MTSVRHICHFCWDHQTSLPQQLGTLPPLALPSNLGTAYALSWHYHPLCTLLPLQLEPLKYWNASKLCEEVDESVCLHFDVKLIQLQATERENPIHAGLSHKSIYSYHVTRSPNVLSSRLGTQIHSTIKHPISFSLDFVILICQLFILRHATPCSQDNCHKSKQYIFTQHQLGKTVGEFSPEAHLQISPSIAWAELDTYTATLAPESTGKGKPGWKEWDHHSWLKPTVILTPSLPHPTKKARLCFAKKEGNGYWGWNGN